MFCIFILKNLLIWSIRYFFICLDANDWADLKLTSAFDVFLTVELGCCSLYIKPDDDFLFPLLKICDEA